MNLSIIILAAGLGKRMRSELPKVLHPLANKPLIRHVVDGALALQPHSLHVVYGHGGDQVRATLNEFSINWVHQAQQLGTGHAVAQAMPNIIDDSMVLVLCGDVPLITPATLEELCSQADNNSLGILTVELDNPQGYGRIVRNAAGEVERIVEEKDADAAIKQIKEVNSGIFLIPAVHLRRWLSSLNNDNAQGEYYLTDIVSLAVAENMSIFTSSAHNVYEVMGINNRVQLAILERQYQKQQAHKLMLDYGVTLHDPSRIDIRGSIEAGHDVAIDVNVVFEGDIKLGNKVKIGPNCIIRNATIGDGVEIFSNCVIENVVIGDNCRIGPLARLRPDTVLAENVRIGNFVEIKKTTVAKGSKINHLSYIGDTEIGTEVNIGAGTITCNYDGTNKHKTIIGDKAFIGSDTQLIAPVTVGAGATIGAGSTISRDTPDDTLTLSRSPQNTVPGWQRPTKK
jgi:bifunctional UDP-N-acetylglucosamine pyrophosphorylase/glucosamine-1-phosphate N-acetyltransferase